MRFSLSSAMASHGPQTRPLATSSPVSSPSCHPADSPWNRATLQWQDSRRGFRPLLKSKWPGLAPSAIPLSPQTLPAPELPTCTVAGCFSFCHCWWLKSRGWCLWAGHGQRKSHPFPARAAPGILPTGSGPKHPMASEEWAGPCFPTPSSTHSQLQDGPLPRMIDGTPA